MAERTSIQKLRELLQQQKYKKVINDDGSVAVPRSAVFSELSTVIGKSDPLSAKNIYTILKLNRYQMHTFILDFYNINYQCEMPVPINSSLDDSCVETLSFTLDISTIWKDIEVEEVTYNSHNKSSRLTYTLKRKAWTNYLFEEIFKNTKINCSLTFKHNKLSKSGYALTVTAICTECGCKFTGCVANEPLENENIVMECQLQNYDALFVHEKKRQLKGTRRQEIAKELVEGRTLPSIWRRNEANRLMEYGDKEPPHLFRSSTLRKAKQVHQDQVLGIKTQNVYMSLHNLKYDPKSEGAIQSIGLDPFFIHYFTNEQIAIFQQYHDSVLIDSTGSLVKKINLPNGKLCPHLFLYQCVTKIENSVYVPVCQMISATQNINAISYWLLEFLRIGSTHKSAFPIPREVVTDFSKALLGAVARAFAKKNTLADYLMHCFKLLLECESILLPCLIRLDICHFMNMIARWKCWSHIQKRVKQFYLRSIAALREQDSLRGIEEHAKAIFIVSLNENQISGKLTDQSRNFLSNSIRGVDVEEQYLKMEVEDDDFNDDNEFKNINIFQWANNLHKQCKQKIVDQTETGDINPYFCPSVAESLRKLLPYFPLFSDVMIPIFKYGTKRPTSAGVESEFNDLKNRVLQDVTTIRVDKFIQRHISSFPGKLKIGLAKEMVRFDDKNIKDPARDLRTDVPEPQHLSNYDVDEFQEEENWRNKNKRQKYNKYVDHLPEFDSSQEIFSTLPVIINGTFSKNIRVDNKVFVVTNTCAFDSICQIIATSLKNCEKYREVVENKNIPVIEAALTLISEGLNNNKFYVERAKLLHNLSIYNAKENRSNIIRIDGDVNIGHLAKSLFADCFSCTVIQTCLKCNKSIRRNHATISVNLELIKKGFHMMKESIINAFEEPKKCCEMTRSRNIDYGSHLIIETDTGEPLKTALNSIPQTLNMTENKNYRLAGVVAYSGTFEQKSIGHYTAYIPIANYWHQYDDTSSKSASYHLEQDCKIYAHLSIYVLK